MIGIKANKANTGKIYCSPANSSVSTGTGLELAASEGYIWDKNGGGDYLLKFYCVSDTAAQTVSVDEGSR